MELKDATNLCGEIFKVIKRIVEENYPELSDKERIDAVSRITAKVFENYWGAMFHKARDEAASGKQGQLIESIMKKAGLAK